MKHFLRLLFIGSVLFVLLGLFRQTQDHADPGNLSMDGLEQVVQCSGILTPHQELPPPVSLSIGSHSSGFALNEHSRTQEKLFSRQSKQQLVQLDCIFMDIKFDLLQRIIPYLCNSSSKEIRS